MDHVRDETSLINPRLKHCSSPADVSCDYMQLRSKINFLLHLPLYRLQIFLTGRGRTHYFYSKIHCHPYTNGIK